MENQAGFSFLCWDYSGLHNGQHIGKKVSMTFEMG